MASSSTTSIKPLRKRRLNSPNDHIMVLVKEWYEEARTNGAQTMRVYKKVSTSIGERLTVLIDWMFFFARHWDRWKNILFDWRPVPIVGFCMDLARKFVRWLIRNWMWINQCRRRQNQYTKPCPWATLNRRQCLPPLSNLVIKMRPMRTKTRIPLQASKRNERHNQRRLQDRSQKRRVLDPPCSTVLRLPVHQLDQLRSQPFLVSLIHHRISRKQFLNPFKSFNQAPFVLFSVSIMLKHLDRHKKFC